MYSGGENAYPFADLVRQAPRGHLPQMKNKRTGERGGGYMLMEPLVRIATESGARLRQDTRFERLVVESDGRVSGVVATSYGAQVVIRARRGVALASGGYAFSPGMLEQHTPPSRGTPVRPPTSMMVRRSGPHRQSAPISATWTPPLLPYTPTRDSWCAGFSWTNTATGSSTRTHTQVGSPTN